jgi:hypothetical protein
MYAIEALLPDLAWTAGDVGFPRDTWTAVHTVPQLDTEQEELQSARRQADMARRFYVNVRITKAVGENRKVVQ